MTDLRPPAIHNTISRSENCFVVTEGLRRTLYPTRVLSPVSRGGTRTAPRVDRRRGRHRPDPRYKTHPRFGPYRGRVPSTGNPYDTERTDTTGYFPHGRDASGYVREGWDVFQSSGFTPGSRRDSGSHRSPSSEWKDSERKKRTLYSHVWSPKGFRGDSDDQTPRLKTDRTIVPLDTRPQGSPRVGGQGGLTSRSPNGVDYRPMDQGRYDSTRSFRTLRSRDS